MIVSIIFIVFLIIFLKKRQKLHYHLPPGPPGIPLLGNLFQIGTKPHLTFSKWSKIYGKLITVYLAHKPALIINDAHLLKELFSKSSTSGRFQTKLLNELSWFGNYGVAAALGEQYLEQKRFLLNAMKESGISRPKYLEPLILSEVETLSNILETEQTQNGKVFLKKSLKKATGSFLWSMTTGEKPTNNSNVFYFEILAQIIIIIKTGLVFFPWLKYFAPEKSGHNKYMELCKGIRTYVENTFKAHKQSRRLEGEPSRDLIDFYIDKVENCHDENSSFFGKNGWKHGFATITNFMIAGIDSTGSMLNWLIFYLIAHPEEQERLWEEIHLVVGTDRNPSLDDKMKMPFMEAVILETFRYSSPSPIGAPHVLLDDISFQGYHLPKGMILVGNLYHMNHDPEIWKDPEMFRPSRFLEKDGQNLKNLMVAFPPGKRACPGEQIAKDLLFMFATKLIQKYKFSGDMEVVESIKEYSKPTGGMLLYPNKFGVVISQRCCS